MTISFVRQHSTGQRHPFRRNMSLPLKSDLLSSVLKVSLANHLFCAQSILLFCHRYVKSNFQSPRFPAVFLYLHYYDHHSAVVCSLPSLYQPTPKHSTHHPSNSNNKQQTHGIAATSVAYVCHQGKTYWLNIELRISDYVLNMLRL